jgi:hypothetical protein
MLLKMVWPAPTLPRISSYRTLLSRNALCSTVKDRQQRFQLMLEQDGDVTYTVSCCPLVLVRVTREGRCQQEIRKTKERAKEKGLRYGGGGSLMEVRIGI